VRSLDRLKMKTTPNEMEGNSVAIDPGAWEKLQATFEGALELDGPEDREAFLHRTLGGSPELLREVREMLREHESAAPLEIEKRFLTEDGGSEPTLAGRSIGVYWLERLIGRGGMGEVYLAERREHQFRQQVALKLLRPGWQGPDALARFRRERQILARLNHPLIAPLLDGGVTDDGRPYLILQYVKGQPITEYCDHNDVPVERRLALFCEVAGAVEYAHRNLVVHRDLKPSNILVTEEGQIRLLDFGIAKLLDPSPEEMEAPATLADWRIMTPEYAAPEQIRGEPVTTATDVHALGVLLYELLTRQRPYASGDRKRTELEKRITEEEPVPPSRARGASRTAKRLRGDLDAIVLKALSKEPENRYPSAGQMALDVERHLAGEPVQVRGPSFGYRFGKLVRRNKIASALTAVCVLLLVGLAITASYQSRRVARERDLARAEQQKAEKVAGLLVEMLKAGNPMNEPQGSEVTVGELLRRTERMVVESRSLDASVQARLKHLLGEAYLERSQFGQARAMLEDALRQTRSVYGEQAEATAAVLHDHARLAIATDSRDRAIPLLRQSLDRHQRLFGEKHEKVAACLRDLALALPVSDESRTLLERALSVERALSPQPNPGLASSLSALGRYHLIAGNLEPAERFFSDALSMLNQLFPEGHPAGLIAANNLAVVYGSQGRFGKSAEMNASLIELKSKLIGPESVDVAIAFGNLGVALAQKGDYRKGEDASRRGLALLVKLLGPEHAQVANATRNLAAIRYLQGSYPEARALIEQAMAIQRRWGADAVDLWGMERHLGAVMIRTGQRAEGLRRLRTAVAKLKSLQPGGHILLADTQAWLGFALLESGAASEAEPLFRDALVFRRASLPANHPKIAEAECGLGWTLAIQGQSRKAEALLGRNLPVFRSWGLADPVTVRQLEKRLAELR